MNKTNNFDFFNSSSPLFSDLSDDQAAEVSGGVGPAILFRLNDQQAQGLLGDNFNSQGNYSFQVEDTNGDNVFDTGDEYSIQGFSGTHNVNGSLQLTSEQAITLGFDGSKTHRIGLGDNGLIIGGGITSPSRASRSRPR